MTNNAFLIPDNAKHHIQAEQAQQAQQAETLLRQLSFSQESIREDERKRIAREIHDDLGQILLTLRMDVAMLHTRTVDTHPRLHQKASMALHHIDASMQSMRTIIHNLRPAMLDLGLYAALEEQVHDFQRNTGIACDLCVDDEDFDVSLNDDQTLALSRIVQESLSNVIRHAKASQVHIAVHKQDAQLEVTIVDNGIGISPDCRKKTHSFGLVGIAERLDALGGTFIVENIPNKGTTLKLIIPL